MFIEVVRYEKVCGQGINLPFYEILPEGAEEYEKALADLLHKGIDDCVMYSVELPNGLIDYKGNVVKYPNLGLKRHISTIMNIEGYRTVLRQQRFSIKDYLS